MSLAARSDPGRPPAGGLAVQDGAAPRQIGVASFPGPLERNPYQRLLYEQLAAHGFVLAPPTRLRVRWLWRARRSVKVLHFHWPQGYWRYNRRPQSLAGLLSWLSVTLFGGRLAIARMLGYRLLWTVHQVYPHEIVSWRIDRVGTRLLARFSHLLIAHDEGTADAVRTELGAGAGDKVRIVPHGSYIGTYASRRSRDEVRAELGIPADAFAFLSFGDLREYKEIRLLFDAFSAAALPDAVLLVAGAGNEALEKAVRNRTAADPRVRAVLGFVPEDQVAELFGACDAAVLARGDGGTSGALILALSMGLPVVVARAPAYVELTGDEEAGWFFTPGDGDSLRAALERAARAPRLVHEGKARAAKRRAEALRWPEIGERTAVLIRHLETS